MKLNKLLVFLCLLMVMLTIASANASDVNEAVIASDINEDAIAIDDAENEDISVSDDSDDVIADSEKTMTDLKNTIDNSQDSTIILSDDYSYVDTDSSLKDGIEIRKSVTIDGQGHKIDANKKMRIFQVTSDATVTFKNISFLNGWTENYGYGGAIWSNGGNVIAINCTFKNNSAYYGGAMKEGTAINCTFIKNKASQEGGAIYYKTNNKDYALNCTFIGNEAYIGSGIYIDRTSAENPITTAENCSFINNTALHDSAMFQGTAVNCTFINNTAHNDGAAMRHCHAVNCTFENNDVYVTNISFSNLNDDLIALDDTILFKGLPECNLTVKATKDGETKTFTCNNAGWEVKDLEPGTYTVKFTINENDNGNKGELENTITVIPSGSKLISELETLINNAQADDTIILNDDYFCIDKDLENGIIIRKNLTIDGQGHKIDANHLMRIFQVTDDATVTFKNMTLTNGWTQNYGYGGAIWGNGGNVIAINCTFENNSAYSGGALKDATAINCTFINNNASDYGGAIHYYNNEKDSAVNCTFIGNKANFGSAMNTVDISTENGITTAENCTFINNTADSYAAMNKGTAVNCTFINNTDSFDIAAMRYCTAVNCTFENNEVWDSTIYFYATDTNITQGDTVLFYGLPDCKLTVEVMNADDVLIETVHCNNTGWEVKDLEDPGLYTVTFIIDDEDEEDEGNEGNFTTQIFVKFKLKLEVNAENVTEGEAATVNVSLKDMNDKDLSGDVKVIINNTEYTVNVVDGKGNITIENLAPGAYAIVALVPEGDLYDSALASNVLIINKPTPERTETKIIYKDMNTTAVAKEDGRIGEYFSIQLVDAKGNPLAGKKVQIGFNGNVYDRITDSDGKARLQINLKNVGTYTFAIAFLGDDEYNGSFVVSKIVVKKQTPKFTTSSKTYKATAKTKSLTATFKTANGVAISGKVVKFTVNGKTYSAKTNANGVATVNVSLNKKGTYSFTAKFAGDNTFAAINKTAKLTIN